MPRDIATCGVSGIYRRQFLICGLMALTGCAVKRDYSTFDPYNSTRIAFISDKLYLKSKSCADVSFSFSCVGVQKNIPEGQEDVYTVQLDGNGEELLISNVFLKYFVWSPNGREAAYLARADEDDSSKQASIMLLDLKTKAHRSMGSFGNASNLTFSPDGLYFAVPTKAGQQSNDNEVAVVNTISAERTFIKGCNKYISWSPNGHKLLTYSDSTYEDFIKVSEAESLKWSEVARGYYPRWLDNDHIIFERENKLCRINISTGMIDALDDQYFKLRSNILETPVPIPSPDGNKVAFLYSIGSPFSDHTPLGIYVLEVSTGKVYRLASVPPYVEVPASPPFTGTRWAFFPINSLSWSPDGDYILYSTFFNMHVCRWDGSYTSQIPMADGSRIHDAFWSPYLKI